MKTDNAIFYIKYYAKKHDCIIERKATLDDECFEGNHKKFGYPYKVYVDIEATKEIDNGKNSFGKPANLPDFCTFSYDT